MNSLLILNTFCINLLFLNSSLKSSGPQKEISSNQSTFISINWYLKHLLVNLKYYWIL